MPFKKLTYLFLFCSLLSFGQNDSTQFPVNYFRSPLNIPLFLSGNFGELRSNHFHSGIDIKTQGTINKEVFAAADGWLSRIRILHGGYGKVLYIDHPNGYTTVYAHLNSFSPKLDSVAKAFQYRKETYVFDQYISKDSVKVKKGEVIALSGNTGGSGGPHLHFEIRETESEIPINPLLCGLPIKDNIPPIVKGVRIYPLDEQSTVDGKNRPKYIKAYKKGNAYDIVSLPVLHGKIGFGIETIDKLNGSRNRCGVYDIQLRHNNNLIFEHKIDKIPFDESRYINSHTDYGFKKTKRKWIHKSFLEPNNKLSIYQCHLYEGKINLEDTNMHWLEYKLTDAYGNTSKAKFRIKSTNKPANLTTKMDPKFTKTFYHSSINEHQTDNFKIMLNLGSLYNDVEFNFKEHPPIPKKFSNTFEVHNQLTPLHKSAFLELKCINYSKIDTSKLVVVRINRGGGKGSIGGKFENGHMKVKTRYFGKFYVSIDTIPPRIKRFNIYNNKNISKQNSFSFIITDNLSGIGDYDCYVDGKWVLMEYNYKKRKLTYYNHGKIGPGKHKLKLVVKDNVGNISTFKCTFFK